MSLSCCRLNLLLMQTATPCVSFSRSSNVMLVSRLSELMPGRMEILAPLPLSQIELERARPTFLGTLFSDAQSFAHNGRLGKELAERIVRGGYQWSKGVRPGEETIGTQTT